MKYKRHPLLTKDILTLQLSPAVRVKLAAANINTIEELLLIQVPKWRSSVPNLNAENVQEIIDFIFRKKLDYILDIVNH